MLDKRTLDTIRSQAEAGEFAHYGGMMVQDLLNHIDALTEQARVLRELLHNAMAYIPNEYDDELALRNSIADALAALEGSGE